MGFKYNKIISKSLISGSSDLLRNQIGGFWKSSEVDDAGNTYLTFDNTNLVSIKKSDSLYFQSVFSQEENKVVIDEDKIVHAVSIPVRIAAKSLAVKSDDHWKTILIGGDWGQKTYSSIFFDEGELTNEYMYINPNFPYTKLENNILNNGYAANVIEVGYNYDQYLPRYQNYINNSSLTEYLLPNFYFMSDLMRWTDMAFNSTDDEEPYGNVGLIYPVELLNFVSLENQYTGINRLFDFNSELVPYKIKKSLLASFGDVRKKNTNLTIDYLNNVYTVNQLSDETIDWASNKQQNMLFDTNAVSYFNLLSNPFEDCLPYRVNVNFNNFESKDFLDKINEHDFSSKFIKTLYSVFGNNVRTLQPSEMTYVRNQNYFTSDSPEADVFEITETEDSTIKEIDYIKFLSYCHNNFNTTDQNNNCMFVGEMNKDRAAAMAENDSYRYINTAASLNLMNHAIEFMNNSLNTDFSNFSDFFKSKSNYVDTVAYRVEKIGGPPVGDNSTQRPLQNFWFMNSSEQDVFNFYDSQVKYNKDYTYNVYAYMIVVGYKYKKNNVLASRHLGCTSSDDMVGLEMYDPFSGETSPELFESSRNSNFDPRAGGSEYGSTAQIFSNYEYIADFNFEYEPYIKIVEFPLFSKTMRVLDNPGNKLRVTPYGIPNNSRKIGFEFYKGSFKETAFPDTITQNDVTLKNHYLNANDLLESSMVTKHTVSKERFVEVYRINEKPTSITDFDGFLRSTVDLRFLDTDRSTKNFAYMHDMVIPNRKYYYLFRMLNQQRVVSHVSEIYEAELVNDGGYNYATFNLLLKDQLDDDKQLKPDKKFKRLLQIRPNLQQSEINFGNLDYTQEASTQIENLEIGSSSDPIWDKTFKIRVTSRKTGRKIDLNVTYKFDRN